MDIPLVGGVNTEGWRAKQAPSSLFEHWEDIVKIQTETAVLLGDLRGKQATILGFRS